VSLTWLRMSRKQAICLFAAMTVFASPVFGQSNPSGSSDDPLANQRFVLLSELQSLGARAKLLDHPLARALAEAEVADAAWSIDRDLAKQLLRDAYDLSSPGEDEQAKLRKLPAGSPPRAPRAIDTARWNVQRRIMAVARRDKLFADELTQPLTDKLGPYESQQTFAALAREALEDGDIDLGSKYIREAIDADPTQSNAAMEIGLLALKDRAAADQAIIHYINRWRSVTLSPLNGSRMRVFLSLAILIITPQANPGVSGSKIAPPGPAAVRSGIAYMLELMNQLDPTVLRGSRGFLFASWPLLQRYAPELKQQFFDLEQRSRAPGDSLSLPTSKSIEQEYKAKFEKRAEKELESDQPDAIVIQRVIGQGDFPKARKMIDKLSDGPQKTELTEMLNAQQAISLANEGDIPGAQKVAESLAKAASILKVFPVIAGKCAAKNDDVCARDSVNQAVRQLKKADVTPFTPPPGVPASFFGTKRDRDPVLSSLGSLVSAVLSVKDELALDVLDELVIAANHSELDTSQARTGFETSLFKKLAAKNEERTTAAAIQFKDPLRQIVALAGIEQWKSDKLAADVKIRSTKNEPAGKKN
jgi:hypothetical protein